MNEVIESSHHFCDSCNMVVGTNVFGEYGTPTHEEHLCHDASGAKPTCITCKSTLRWVEDTRRPRTVPGTFDIIYQVMRDSDGNAIEDTGDHFCGRCSGPAVITSIHAYGERHKCNNCSHEFTVS